MSFELTWKDSLTGSSIESAACFREEAVGQVLVESHRQVRHMLHEPSHTAHLIQDGQYVVSELH